MEVTTSIQSFLDRQEIRKIAFLRANALGDFIFGLPALKALKLRFPKAELVYLGRPWHKSFLDSHLGIVDRTIVVPISRGIRNESGQEQDSNELHFFFEHMKQEQFDLALQMHGGGRNSNPFVNQLGAKFTLGLSTPEAESLSFNVPYIYYQSEIMRLLEVVSFLGITELDYSPTLSATVQDIRDYEAVADIKKPFVIIHSGASDVRRRWSPSHFVAVGDYLSRKGLEVVLTGVESERNLTRDVFSQMKKEPLDLTGRLTLNGMTGLLSQAALLISNDTGPLHLGRALGIPTVGIYWGGNMINGGPLKTMWHRSAISWMIHCPLCGADCASVYPFQRISNAVCEHTTSFVEEVTVQNVVEEAISLLSLKGINL